MLVGQVRTDQKELEEIVVFASVHSELTERVCLVY